VALSDVFRQDSKQRVMAFRLKEGSGGMMRKFEGAWRVQPCPGTDGKASIVTLCQKVMPTITAPGLDWIVVGVCKRQISNLMEDLKSEIKRINEGKPIPPDQLRKMTGKSWKDAEVKGFAVELSDSDDDDHVAADSSDVVAGRQMPRQVGPQHQWELLAAAEHLGIAEEHVNAKEMQQANQ